MTPARHPDPIFISYARKDGRDLALRLQADLSADGHAVWLDTADIDGGASWSVEIENAIERCAVALTLLSHGSFASEICRAEQLRALRKRKRIIPLLVQADAERPLHLEALNFRDFSDRERYSAMLAVLRADLAGAGDLFPAPPHTPTNADPLPPDFVERPAIQAQLRAAILDDASDRRVALTAVHGIGGIGKSVLASALCHDPVIRDAYPDGVIWLKIGQTPGDLAEQMRVVGRTLGDDMAHYTSATEAASRLRTLLPDKSVLVVLDDVWDARHVLPFVIEAPRSRVLFTTRDRGIAERHDIRAAVLTVQPMTTTEALALLHTITKRNDPALNDVARAVGYHPLALSLAGGRIRRGMTPVEWLRAFGEMHTAFIRAGRRADGRHDSIEACFSLSIEALDPADRPLYHTLGIFAKDTWIPRATVRQLWGAYGLSDYDADDLIAQVVDLALVEQRADDGALSLHDLLHDYNRSCLDDPAAIHGRLLDAWGDHSALPDAYAWRNIAYHLREAGKLDTLRALLLDYRFLGAKLDATEVNALIADCDYLPGDEAIRVLKSALSMSAHVLNEDKDQLPYQITGRLWTHRDKPNIAPLWEQAQSSGRLELLGNKDYPPLMQAGGMLLRTLRGHDGRVTGALQLEDGRILSWSDDKTFRLWSPEGEMLVILDGHELGGIGGALELEDGRILAWSEYNGRPQLWTSQGEALSIPYDDVPWIRGVLKLNDRRLLLWAWSDYTLRLWSPSGELLTVLEGHTDWINGALELVDGRVISWGQGEKILRLWSAQGEPLAVLEGHTCMIEGALALADGRLLSWSDDKTLRLWSTDGELMAVLEGHTGKIEGVHELTDGRLLSWSNDARLWSSAGELLSVFEGYRQGSKILELADGQLLSWNYSDSTPQLWTSQGEPLAELKGHIYGINGVLALEDGRILSWGNDKILRLWSSAGESLAVLRGHTGRKVEGALTLADGRMLSWSDDKTLRLWSLQNDPLIVLEAHDNQVKDVLALKGEQLLSWSYNKTLRLWSIEGEPLTLLYGHASLVYGALELEDGRILSWSRDKTLRLWSSAGESLTVLKGHTDDITGVLVLTDGRILSWSDDKTLRLWSSAGEALAELKGHTYKVGGALELDDGQILSWPMKKGHVYHSGDYDVNLRLWSPVGELLTVLEGHADCIEGALSLTDGRILSWSGVAMLRLWSAQGESLVVLEGHPYLKINGALELAGGRILSWSKDKNLRLWSSAGESLVVLEGHTDSVEGALSLADGRILSWSDDKTLRLWSSVGEPLAVLDNWEQNEEALVTWSQKHRFDVRVLYEGDAHNPDSIFVRRVGARLWVHNIGQFIGDAEFKALAVHGQTVVLGDEAGRVIFLRVRDGKGSAAP